MQSAWKREPTIPIFTFGTMSSPVRRRPTSSPRRLSRCERDASDPFAGNHDVAERLRQPDLGGEEGLKREFTDESEIMLSLIHISEPTRLGMISYAVFCLKKKK